MNSQSFANPSLGMVVGRALASTMSAVARVGRTTWDWLGYLGQARARGHLLLLARSHEATRPELAAQLRAAAERNWFGEA